MIKVIVFDLVGVLINETDNALSTKEDKLKRLFGSNISDEEYLNEAKNIIGDETVLINTVKKLCDKLYEVMDKDLFKKIKEKYSDIKIIIASNHV